MAAAVAAVFGLMSSNAAALSLGRMTVQSALGEPLRAEIDVPDINADEASSLKAAVALPEAFRAAGLEYNPAMSSLQATLQRRADGRAYIRLSSDRPINDPFVDMILEASWSSGRIVRDYTMLFDPPTLKSAAPAATPTQAQVPASPSTAKSAVTGPATATPQATPLRPPVEPRKITAKAPESPAAAKSPVSPSPAASPAAPAAAAKSPEAQSDRQVKVKPGDTASKIAAAVKPASVSLDQMLVALLRSNPDAFVGGNINRVKAGAVMNVPAAEQISANSATEANQVIVAQSKDFNDFRRKLAGIAPSAQVVAADRKASGTVQTKVEDKKPATAAPDKLTLSKGAVLDKSADDKLAKERSAKEAAARAAEIAKNISELSKLGAGAGLPAPGASAPASAKPVPAVAVTGITPPAQVTSAPVVVAAVPAPVASAPAVDVVPPALAASAAASEPAAASSAAASQPEVPASAVANPAAIAMPLPIAEPSMVDELMENPLVPAGAVGLIALLAGFGFYRFRQRKNTAQVDSSFLESRLQPDSFFGASGGQSVDTSDSGAAGSSMVYSPSQLDAADDVDPVAEADVYLAYGRDMQAEEILNEALRTNPGRIAIHQKLLDIYAKRRDTQGFERVATLAYRLTNGDGSEWQRVSEMGLGIDPTNPLYQPGGKPDNRGSSSSNSGSQNFGADLSTTPVQAKAKATEAQKSSFADLDLDLDFSLDEEPVSPVTAPVVSQPEPTVKMQAAKVSEPPELDFDIGFDIEPVEPAPAPDPIPAAAASEPSLTESIEFSLPDMDLPESSAATMPNELDSVKQPSATNFGATTPAPLDKPAPVAAPAEPDLGMLEFDLGSLSLDLDSSTEGGAAGEPEAPEDPLATKLALAEEFSAIGDEDGARSLIEEVIAEATGDMKIKAQRALSNL